jgi:ABC-2 type transport system permease protein
VRYFYLLFVFTRLAIPNETQYRANFMMQVLGSGLELGTSLAGLAVVFEHTDALGGWSPPELVALLGVYTLVKGLANAVVQPSLAQFMSDVRLGSFDFTLTRPENAQFLVSVQRLQIWELVDMVLGVGLLALALARLGATVTLWHSVAFVVTLLAGLALVYSFLLALATLSFWLVRLEYVLSLFTIVYQAGQWPLGIYPRGLRFVLALLVPIGFAVSVPAGALTGRVTWPVLPGAVILALAAFLGSRWFWQFGVRHYSGASA